MIDPNSVCPIWGEGFGTKGISVQQDGILRIEDSPRAGGGYCIAERELELVQGFDERLKARLTTALIDQRAQGVDCPQVTVELLEDAIHGRPLPVYERAERLLKYLVEQTTVVGVRVPIAQDEYGWRVMAWTESADISEAMYYPTYLERMGWINVVGAGVVVQVEGFSQVADQATNLDSSQAFVAMWFHEELEAAYEHGIRHAIEEAGFRPMRIDRKLDVGKVDDEIIAEIRRSRFLVADFTHGRCGARGSVYFEAGFALGLSIPVIFCCRRDDVSKPHFDTQQYYHIFWDSPDELYSELLPRIRARIGEGPELRAGRPQNL